MSFQRNVSIAALNHPSNLDYFNNEKDEETKANNWLATAMLIVAAMAGIGVLGLPQALAKSGWIGVPLMLICAMMANITANLLGALMRRIAHYDEVKEFWLF